MNLAIDLIEIDICHCVTHKSRYIKSIMCVPFRLKNTSSFNNMRTVRTSFLRSQLLLFLFWLMTTISWLRHM